MSEIQRYYFDEGGIQCDMEGDWVKHSDHLAETTRLRESLAWAAECQSATLETLPKSASKRDRERHVTLCKKLAGLLIGAPVERRGFQPFDIEKTVEEAYQRCERAASADQQNINPTGEENE